MDLTPADVCMTWPACRGSDVCNMCMIWPVLRTGKLMMRRRPGAAGFCVWRAANCMLPFIVCHTYAVPHGGPQTASHKTSTFLRMLLTACRRPLAALRHTHLECTMIIGRQAPRRTHQGCTMIISWQAPCLSLASIAPVWHARERC